MHAHLLENIQRLEGPIQLSKLLQLQLLQVVVITRNINTTLDDGLDLLVQDTLSWLVCAHTGITAKNNTYQLL